MSDQARCHDCGSFIDDLARGCARCGGPRIESSEASRLTLDDRRGIYSAVARVVMADGTVRRSERGFVHAARLRLGIGDAEARAIEGKVAVGLAPERLPQDEAARRVLLRLVAQATGFDVAVDAKAQGLLTRLRVRLGLGEDAARPGDSQGVLPPHPASDTWLAEEAAEDVHELLNALRGPARIRSLLRVRTHALGLIAVNCWALAGVLFLGWDIFFVMMSFWADNVVRTLFFGLKQSFAQGWSPPSNPILRVPLGGLLLLLTLFMTAMFVILPWVFLHFLFDQRPLEYLRTPSMLAGIVLAFLVHGRFFVKEYLQSGEYLVARPFERNDSTIIRLIMLPGLMLFPGVVFFHVPRLLCAILVTFKAWLDLWDHRRERSAPH